MDSLNTDNNDDSNRLDSKPAANDDDGSDASSSGGNTGSADDDNVKSSAQPQHEINDSSLAVSLTANPTNDAMSSENARPPQALLTKFPARLHRMLSGVEKDGLDHIVSWRPHGRCFGVNKAKDFVKRILPLYVTGMFDV